MASKISHGRVLNWKRDLPRTSKMWKTFYSKNSGVTTSVLDLRAKCPPIVDQGQMGSCTGNAIAGALGFLELANDRVFDFISFQPFSRLFIYWNERTMEGDTSQDAGASIHDGVASVEKIGACREETWPYQGGNLFAKPSDVAFGQAASHRVTRVLRLDNTKISQLKSCLSKGFPFVFGITVYESFFNTGADGIVPHPGAYESVEGGHALCCVGYDNSKQAFIVRNSWGTSWGDQGYCYIGYDYMTNPNLASDFWSLEK